MCGKCTHTSWTKSFSFQITLWLCSIPSLPPPHIPSGTYCHQREVEAITEPISDTGNGCCLSCYSRKIPGVLSVNAALGQRWTSWEVMSSCYILKGYGIVENVLSHLFNAYEYRRGYLTYLVQVCVCVCVRAHHSVSTACSCPHAEHRVQAVPQRTPPGVA